jgi:hypothetical protein
MATEFVYVKAANVPILRDEIEADAGITTALSFIVVDGTDLHIHFVTDLSAGEVTALDAVVAAHTGVPSVEPGGSEPPVGGVDETDPEATGSTLHDRQHVVATSEVQTNSTSYIDLDSITLTTRDLMALGNYHIWFTCIFDMNNDDHTGDFRLLVDGVEKASGSFNVEDDGGAGQVALLIHEEASLADGKVIKAQFKSSNGSTTLKVFRRSLTIDGITQARVLTA